MLTSTTFKPRVPTSMMNNRRPQIETSQFIQLRSALVPYQDRTVNQEQLRQLVDTNLAAPELRIAFMSTIPPYQDVNNGPAPESSVAQFTDADYISAQITKHFEANPAILDKINEARDAAVYGRDSKQRDTSIDQAATTDTLPSSQPDEPSKPYASGYPAIDLQLQALYSDDDKKKAEVAAKVLSTIHCLLSAQWDFHWYGLVDIGLDHTSTQIVGETMSDAGTWILISSVISAFTQDKRVTTVIGIIAVICLVLGILMKTFDRGNGVVIHLHPITGVWWVTGR